MLLRVLCIALLSTALSAELHEADENTYDFDSAKRYCSSLGNEWRVLGIKELFELKGQTERFSEERSYWSSDTADAGISRQVTGSEGEMSVSAEYGYTFYLQDGDVTISPIKKQAGVICTDQPTQLKPKAYTVQDNGILDKKSKILWAHLTTHDKSKKLSYEAAQEFCENLELDDREWRLPTVEELYGIVTYERTRPSVRTDIFGVMFSRYYWSDDEFNDDEAYVVGFKLGSVATSDKENESYFRCVSELQE